MTDKEKIENFLKAKGFKRNVQHSNQYFESAHGLTVAEEMLSMPFTKFLKVFTEEMPHV